MFTRRCERYYVFASIVLVVGIVGTTARAPQRIIGGSDAGPTEFPWQVSLRDLNSHYCGGAIIGKRHILTAGHCVSDKSVDRITAVVGTNSLLPGAGETYRIKSFKIHPEYRSQAVTLRQHDNDIAVISLMKEITMNQYRQIIALPSTNVPDHIVGEVSGFGLTADNLWASLATTLQKLPVSIIEPAECSRDGILIRPYEICALSFPGFGACDGDSGGPMVYNGAVVGIVSTSFGDCANGKPDIFTRVYYYNDFIKGAIAST